MQIRLFVSFLAMVPFAAAQDIQEPATRLDVQNAAKRIERSNQATKKAIDRIAAGQKDVAGSVEKQGNDINAQLSAIVEKQEVTARRNLFFVESTLIGLSAVLILGCAVIIAVVVRSWRRTREVRKRAENRSRGYTDPKPIERLHKPDVPMLQRLKEQTGQTRFPITVVLGAKKGHTSKPPMDCDAVFLEGETRPVVQFPGETDWVNWGKREKHAAAILAKRTATPANETIN